MKLEKPNFGPVYTPFGQKTTEQELHGLYMVWNPSNIWVRKATEILSHSFWSWVLVPFQFLGEHYRLGNVFSFFRVGRLSYNFIFGIKRGCFHFWQGFSVRGVSSVLPLPENFADMQRIQHNYVGWPLYSNSKCSIFHTNNGRLQLFLSAQHIILQL